MVTDTNDRIAIRGSLWELEELKLQSGEECRFSEEGAEWSYQYDNSLSGGGPVSGSVRCGIG